MGNALKFAGRQLLTAVALIVIALWIGYQTGAFNALAKGYDCDNMKSEVVAISEKNAPQGGATIVGIVSARETSKSSTTVECTGTAKWSDATESAIAYKAYLQENQWWIEYHQL